VRPERVIAAHRTARAREIAIRYRFGVHAQLCFDLLGRPAPVMVVLCAASAVAAVVLWMRLRHELTPPTPIEIGDRRPGPEPESPAVIGLLTNGYRVPRTAVIATAIDLIRRGWLRAASSEHGELVILTRGTSTNGDTLRPAEQMVLNHLTANSYDGATSATILFDVQERLSRTWLRRFNGHVAEDARSRGLTRRRWQWTALVPVALVVGVGLVLVWLGLAGASGLDSFSDAWLSRAVLAIALATLIVVGVGLVRTMFEVAEAPTEDGQRRAGQWIGYRRRLAGMIPDHASVIGAPEHQLLLAQGLVLGLAPQVVDELPVIDDDPTLAWSDAGGLAHVVAVVRPRRPGYGRHPATVATVGAAALIAAQLLQRFLHAVRDDGALSALVTSATAVTAAIEEALHVIGTALWIPSAIAIWALVIGVVDVFWVRNTRGPVVKVRRSRPPQWIPERLRRDRFSLDLAVDDGGSARVRSLVANERTAIPEGVWAQVRSTRLLGHIHSVRSAGDTG
jgi:hypothetical protein